MQRRQDNAPPLDLDAIVSREEGDALTDEEFGVLMRLASYAWDAVPACSLPALRSAQTLALLRAGVRLNAESKPVSNVLRLWTAGRDGRLYLPRLRACWEAREAARSDVRERMAELGRRSGKARQRPPDPGGCSDERPFNDRSTPVQPQCAPSEVSQRSALQRSSPLQMTQGALSAPEEDRDARIGRSAGAPSACIAGVVGPGTKEAADRTMASEAESLRQRMVLSMLARAEWPWVRGGNEPDRVPARMLGVIAAAAWVTVQLADYVLTRISEEKPRRPLAWLIAGTRVGRRGERTGEPWTVAPTFVSAADKRYEQLLELTKKRIAAEAAGMKITTSRPGEGRADAQRFAGGA